MVLETQPSPPERSPDRRGASASEDPVAAGEACYAVLDIETTGLDAEVDRVVECAVVELDASGHVLDEWVSLVIVPGREELGAHFVHGIKRSMLAGAPTFGELLPELVRRLRRRVIVGHVLAFDLAHLAAESLRSGVELPDLRQSGLCTRELAVLHLPAGLRSLESCCAATGVRLTDAHSALGDARATAALLRWFIDAGHAEEWADQLRAARSLWWPAVGPTRPLHMSGVRRPPVMGGAEAGGSAPFLSSSASRPSLR